MNKQVPKRSLGPIIEETVEAINTDIILKRILEDKSVSLSAIIPCQSEATEEIQSRMELAEALVREDYRLVCEQEIIDHCSGNVSKNTLLILAKLYVSYLCGSGFHRGYIYDSAIQHFAVSRIGRCTKNLLASFFARFPKDGAKKYSVVLCGSKKYVDFIHGVFGLDIFDDDNDLKMATGLNVPTEFSQGANKKLLLLQNIPAKDPFKAVVAGESLLGVSRSFLFIYPSGLKEMIDNDALVFSGKKTDFKRVSRKQVLSISTSQASRPESVSKAARSFSRFAFNRKTYETEAGDRVFRALNAAALAGNSTDPETQLVTLWSAFEALLPPPTKDEKGPARIVHFVKLIVPALSYGYLRSKYDFFIRDLTKAQRREVKTILDAHANGASYQQKLADLLTDDPNQARRIAAALSVSPLLVNRVSKLFEITQKPKNALAKLKAHELRLGWQVHRIYRERNEIVHSGSSSPFLIPLVENAFFYFRILASRLEATHNQYSISDPHAALQLISAQQTEMKTKLESIIQNQEITASQRRKQAVNLIFRS
ncbi:hypothetical protein [Roseovarius pacificus]|uniref:hypothetical protein n=1 Tax=Roseovarius pacificus TaxID=337701 RepID=UPI002A18D02C|nr:hypothetical protein [Roseovarius pacificus]